MLKKIEASGARQRMLRIDTKSFPKHIFNKEFISRIYKVFQNSTINKPK